MQVASNKQARSNLSTATAMAECMLCMLPEVYVCGHYIDKKVLSKQCKQQACKRE